MYCIGLTGTIASGKSSVAALFAKNGIEIISADHIAKALTLPGEAAFQSIITHFGKNILNEFGELNRPYLRQIIFNDPLERQWLEALLHPLIRARIETKVHQHQSTYCVVEIPLLFDKNDYPYFNRILVVLSPYAQRLERLTQRDTCTEKEALSILAVQAKDTAYQSIADDIIINDGSQQDLEKKVFALHQQYLQEAKAN